MAPSDVQLSVVLSVSPLMTSGVENLHVDVDFPKNSANCSLILLPLKGVLGPCHAGFELEYRHWTAFRDHDAVDDASHNFTGASLDDVRKRDLEQASPRR